MRQKEKYILPANITLLHKCIEGGVLYIQREDNHIYHYYCQKGEYTYE